MENVRQVKSYQRKNISWCENRRYARLHQASIKSRPRSNNLKSDDPLVVAEEIINVCETVERESPNTKVAISELTARQDSEELERKRITVNKTLRFFVKTRDWKIISQDNIDVTCLNGRKLHLNARGTINLAKDFKTYLINLH